MTRWWRRDGRIRPVVRLLMRGEEAYEGTLVGRWDGHYHLDDAVLVTFTRQGTDRRRVDGRLAVQEAAAHGYQVVGEVHA